MNLNYRVVIRQLGLLLFVLSALIGAVGLFGVVDHLGDATKSTGDVAALFLTAFVGLTAGGLFHVCGRRMSDNFGQREALLLVKILPGGDSVDPPTPVVVGPYVGAIVVGSK